MLEVLACGLLLFNPLFNSLIGIVWLRYTTHLNIAYAF
jgi:hypothetical protein